MLNKEEILKEIYQNGKIIDSIEKIQNMMEGVGEEYKLLEAGKSEAVKEIHELTKDMILSDKIDSNIIDEKEKVKKVFEDKLFELKGKIFDYDSILDKLYEKKDKKTNSISLKISGSGCYNEIYFKYRDKYIAKYLSKKFNKEMEYVYYETTDIERGYREDKHVCLGIISTKKIVNALSKYQNKFSKKEIYELQTKMCKDNINILNNEFIITNEINFNNILIMNTKELNQNKELLNVLLDYYQSNLYNKPCSYEKE